MTELNADQNPQLRQDILNVALSSFSGQGAKTTTLESIASEVGQSVDTVKQYFPDLTALMLAVYTHLSQESLAQIKELERGTMANRFYKFMQAKFAQITPYRYMMATLFSSGMNPETSGLVTDAGTVEMRRAMLATFSELIEGAKDATKPPQTKQIITISYGMHLLIIAFWLYDRTQDNKASYEFLDLFYEAMKMARPLLVLPFFDKALLHLTEVLQQVFVGDIM